MKKFLFISTALGLLPLSVLAEDRPAWNWQEVNDAIISGNQAVLQQDAYQWDYGIIGIDLNHDWAGLDGQNHTLYGGNVNNPKKFIEWQDNYSHGYTTLLLKNVNLRNFHDESYVDYYGTKIVASAVLNVHSNGSYNKVELYNIGFYNNYVEFNPGSETVGAQGGAFRNYVTYAQDLFIDNATFDSNHIKITGAPVNSYSEAHGGAVYIALSQYVDQDLNQNTYAIFDSYFSNNYVETNARNAQGGALYVGAEKSDNLPSIDLSGVIFENNKAISTSTSLSDNERNARGGAVMNKGLMSIDDSLFSGNAAESSGSSKAAVAGGAIANTGTISSLDAGFDENYAYSANNKAYGGAVYNDINATIGTISGDFDGNYTTTDSSNSTYSNAAGGAIYNAGNNQGHGTITSINSNFSGNYAKATSATGQAQGGAIFNTTGASVTTITGNFDQNEVIGGAKAQGGAVYTNSATIGEIFGDFTSNKATSDTAADGGAMFVQGTTVNLSGDLLNNGAIVSEGGTARGGAVLINNNGKLNLIADATSSTDNYKDAVTIQGNYIKVGDADAVNEAIYTSGGTAMIKPQVNFASNGGGVFNLYDYINGDYSGVVTFSGDGYGVLNLYNDILGQSSVVFNSAYTIATTDGTIDTTTIENLTTNTTLNLLLDISLAGTEKDEYDYYKGIDKLNFTNNTLYYNLQIVDFNILTDMADGVYEKSLLYSVSPSDYVTGSSNFYTQSSNYIYSAENDVNVATLIKRGKADGYVTYLRNMLENHQGSTRTYDFTANGTEYINYDGTVILDDSDLTINGNRATLTQYEGQDSSALRLSEDQSASITKLTITGFTNTAIYNSGTIKQIDGNTTFSHNEGSYGAAIENVGLIKNLAAGFSYNSSDVDGGAIDVYGEGAIIESITGDFSHNDAVRRSGAIAVGTGARIDSISGNLFEYNQSSDITGAIGVENGASIGYINSWFVENYATNGGGAIGNEGTIGELYGLFNRNYTDFAGGALTNIGNINLISADFINNKAVYYGAAIVNMTQYQTFAGDGTMTFLADAEYDDVLEDDIEFNGNYLTSNDDDEAILNAAGGVINFNATHNGSYTFYDSIHGLTDTYNLFGGDDYTGVINFTSEDNTGVLNLYNDIIGQAEVNVSGFTINTSGNLDDDDKPVLDVIHIDNLNILTTSNLRIDLDLSTMLPTSDYIMIDGFSKNATFNLSSLNLIGNFASDQSAARKIEYTNIDNLTEASNISITNSSAQYQIQNDGRYLEIYKIGDGLTYEEFLANKNGDTTAPRTYAFEEDQTMGSWADGLRDQSGSSWTAASWVNAPTPIVVEGKNHTLAFIADDYTQALNLASGQTATINDLTLKDFQRVISNEGNLTLKNVTINSADDLNNDIALENSGTVSAQGLTIDGYTSGIDNEGTFSGNNITVNNSSGVAINNEAGTFEATGVTLNKNADAVVNNGTSMSLSNIDISETTNVALMNRTTMTVNGGSIDGATNAVYNAGAMTLTGVDISDGGNAVINFDDLTLNNVTIHDSDVAITSNYGTVKIAGETTLKDNANDFYGKPVHYDQLNTDYPIAAAYYEIYIPTVMGGGDYDTGFANASEYFSNKAGHTITITNGAECALAWAEVAYIEGKTSQNPSEYELLKTDIPSLTEEQYNLAKQNIFEVAQEDPYKATLMYFALRSGYANIDEYYNSLSTEQKTALDNQLKSEEMQLKTSGAPDIRRLFGDVDVGKNIDILMTDNAVLNVQSGMDGADTYSVTFRGSNNSVVKIGSVSDTNIDINMAEVIFNGPNSELFNANFANASKAVENKSGNSQIRSVVFTNVDNAVENSGMMTVADSTFNGGDVALKNNTGATISVTNTTFESTKTVIDNAGTATLGTGVVISDADNAVTTSGELTLSGVTIKDSDNAILVEDDGIINIAGENTFENNINEIYGKSGTLTMNLANGTNFAINDGVDGDAAFGLVLKGNTSSAFNVNTDMKKADLVLDGITLKIDDESTNVAGLNSFEARSGVIDMQDDYIRQLTTNNFTVSGAISLLLDVDLEAETMDTLGDLTASDGAVINVSGMNILTDTEKDKVSVAFAKDNYKDKVATSLHKVYSAQNAYDVTYNAETGEFEFSQGSFDPTDIDANLMAGISSATAQMLHSSINMQILERDLHSLVGLSSGDMFHASPWVKTFGSSDDVELKHTSGGIDAKFYGVIGGVDSKVIRYCNGFRAVYGLYGAYVQSTQEFNHNKIHQKGGYVGASAAFKKGIFFTNFSANGGYITNEAKTAAGKDKFNTKVASTANKTGLALKYRGINITPSVMVSYMAVDTDDYTNKAGVKIENNLLHVFEVRPELRVSKDFANGLTLYAKAAYVADYYEGGKIKANSVLLPNISAKPYVEYGLGIEKDWKQCVYCRRRDMTSFANVNRHDGGREGWDVNGGIKLEF